MSNLLKISESASLALHVMVLLAKRYPERATGPEAAARFKASEHTLAKVLQKLVKADLVESVRGPQGGFCLQRPASEMTLRMIFEAVEGPIGPASCLLATPVCSGKNCILGPLVAQVQSLMTTYLQENTLAQLADRLDLRELPEPLTLGDCR